LVVAMVGLAVAGGAANAAQVATMGSWLNGDLGTLWLWSTVDLTGGTYTYDYYLTASNVLAPVTTFSVGNPRKLAYANAWNDGLYGFVSPVYSGTSSIVWDSGSLPNTFTGHFSYTSVFPWMEVSAHVLDEGMGAGGKTLGMVPEPWTILSASALIAPAGLLFRRRRRA